MIVAVLVLILAAALCACNKKPSEEEYSNMSRSVKALYVGESETFAVAVETGSREHNFIADGVATDVSDFAEICVIPLRVNDLTEIGYTLLGNGASVTGTLKGNDNGEFISSLTLDFAPLSVTLTSGENSVTVDLQNVIEGKLSASDAVNVAEKEFAERISSEINEKGALKREIYVKLITGDRENYYYYVSYIGEGMDYWAVLINPETGAVVSKK